MYTKSMFFEQYFCPYSAPFPPTPHRTAPTLHPAMANCNIRPVGVTGCQGLQAGVINLKPLNRFIVAAHFKMEGLAMLKDLLRPGDWMASIDLKDAYLSVAIWEEHRKYLRFVWNSQLYEFQCLPFGLCSAPRVFTKLLKPVLARLRHQGIRLIMYLDDMLVMAQSREELEGHLLQITSLIEFLGFLYCVYTNHITRADSVRHAQSRYLIESKHVLNQAIPNHDSSHKSGVPARFEYWHGFQTYLLFV